MTDTRRPASAGLPRVWVERGGPALAVVLDAIDAAWAAAEWPPRPDPAAAAAVLAAAVGLRPVLAEVGPAGVRRPERLPALLLATLGGKPTRLADWLDCCFGVALLDYATTPPAAGRPAAARLTLAGAPADPTAVARVVRRLVPAHVALDAQSFTWVPDRSEP